MNREERLIHIHHCRGIGWRGIDKLLKEDQDLVSIYELSVNTLIREFSFQRQYAELFHRDLHTLDIEKKLEDYKAAGIEVLTVFDPEYPPLLKMIYDPPWVLYTKGNRAIFQHQQLLSVVGTRKPTKEGLTALRFILTPLVDQGWTIVSGMALGVDGAAHHHALRSSTIAVLGSGLLHPYPKKHLSLFQNLIKYHLVISEYPPDQPPKRWQFPERNRIVSGLSMGTLVVEAQEKSGSLITADQALEQGREVFAIPGNIFNMNTVGTHRLIQQGAQLVTSAEDILSQFSTPLTR
ncbi:DNA processing protein [Pullulanibacillus pueri]|uniref:DNA processing protein DprA n=1 Tax=Pullulanibacillus pueri TaxID=1437324 RepID=A0A8J2ZWW7_9BACL|nr:DNA-processing protein DprA [Pullulanibacillus pueri]MBM7682465.1 DNA processing protein [Pullulanibacillus pueri]GGH82288.1 DNA processing protein DprA [Pullulanibacillus pueri]